MPPREGSAGPPPWADTVFNAVESLYANELKPIDRLVRKRVLELCDLATTPGSQKLDIRLPELREVCAAHPRLQVEDAVCPEYYVLIKGRQGRFVDTDNEPDNYPEAMWDEAAKYFGRLPDDAQLPGGRLACAQRLARAELPFIKGYTLGQVVHIVQLATTTRKLLGYSRGQIVPFHRCDIRMKELAAKAHSPSPAEKEGEPLPCATWDTLREGVRELMTTSPDPDGRVPLSNVRRLCRTHCGIELNETMLGCSKLSEVFRHECMQDICVLQRCKTGLEIHPRSGGDVPRKGSKTPPARGPQPLPDKMVRRKSNRSDTTASSRSEGSELTEEED